MNISQFSIALFTAMVLQTEYSDSHVTKAMVDTDRFYTEEYKAAQQPTNQHIAPLFN